MGDRSLLGQELLGGNRWKERGQRELCRQSHWQGWSNRVVLDTHHAGEYNECG